MKFVSTSDFEEAYKRYDSLLFKGGRFISCALIADPQNIATSVTLDETNTETTIESLCTEFSAHERMALSAFAQSKLQGAIAEKIEAMSKKKSGESGGSYNGNTRKTHTRIPCSALVQRHFGNR